MRPLLGINSSSVPTPSTCLSRTTEKNIEADKCSIFTLHRRDQFIWRKEILLISRDSSFLLIDLASPAV